MMDDVFEEDDDELEGLWVKHKEEGVRRRSLDADDRPKIKEELKQHIHLPKATTIVPMNVRNGHIAVKRINVHHAVVLG